MAAPGKQSKPCPYLGLADDRRKRANEADPSHRCYAFGRAETILAAWQSERCLGGLFCGCPRYKIAAGPLARAWQTLRLTVGLLWRWATPRRRVAGTILLSLSAALLFLAWGPLHDSKPSEAATTPTETATSTATHTVTPSPSSTATPSATPPDTATWTATATSSATQTQTPTATETPTETPTHTPTATPTPAATSTPTATETPTPFHPPASKPPTRLHIPSIEVDSQVVEIRWETYVDHKGRQVTGWHVADYAAGWHYGSAYPGRPGNCVISGHNNFRGEVFRRLSELSPGDDVYLYVEEAEYRYAVTDVLLLPEDGQPEEVQQANARWIAPTQDERLTLVSCWPYAKPTHRVIVVCKPLPLEAPQARGR